MKIHFDNRAAILAWSSRLANGCLQSLSMASRDFINRPVWASGHSGIAENSKADELTRSDTSVSLKCRIETSRSSVGLLRFTTGWLDLRQTRQATNNCVVAKTFWSRLNRKSLVRESSELYALNKVHRSIVVGVLTGHYPFGVHAVLKILPDVSRKSCWEEDKIESSNTSFSNVPRLPDHG